MKELRRFLKSHRRLLVGLLLLLGALLRLFWLGKIPYGLNQDEASAGYEAWALLHGGMDRCGQRWPVLFISWGSGQNVLYSYLLLPFIAIGGLNTLTLRLPAALGGVLSLWLFYDLARRVRGDSFALAALLVLAVNPWHVLLSRWALESNLLPLMLLLGMVGLIRARERERWLLLAAAAFGLALYAYGTAYLFLLFFLPPAAVLLLRRRETTVRCFLLAMGLFLLLAFPITLCNARNIRGEGGMTLLGMTLPALTQTRQSSVMSLDGPVALGKNLLRFLKLLWTQNDGLLWNYAGPFGLLYGKPGLALALWGLLVGGQRRLTGKERGTGEGYILLALLASFLSALFMDINVNRVNMAFLPLLWLQAAGLWDLCRRFTPALAAALLVAAGLFARYYFTDYADRLAPSFYAGLGEAVEYAAGSGEETVWVSWDVNMPYIYVLFYEQIPAETFTESAVYINPDGAFRWVSRMEGWAFGREPPGDGTLCILRQDKTAGMEILAQYGEWAVARPGG